MKGSSRTFHLKKTAGKKVISLKSYITSKLIQNVKIIHYTYVKYNNIYTWYIKRMILLQIVL